MADVLSRNFWIIKTRLPSMNKDIPASFNLDSAVQDAKAMQDFESESLWMEVENRPNSNFFITSQSGLNPMNNLPRMLFFLSVETGVSKC